MSKNRKHILYCQSQPGVRRTRRIHPVIGPPFQLEFLWNGTLYAYPAPLNPGTGFAAPIPFSGSELVPAVSELIVTLPGRLASIFCRPRRKPLTSLSHWGPTT